MKVVKTTLDEGAEQEGHKEMFSIMATSSPNAWGGGGYRASNVAGSQMNTAVHNMEAK
jgi:hypothetical protein